MNRSLALVFGASALSLATGAGLGYWFARNQLEQEYRELSDQEIAEAKKFYSVLYKKTEDTKTPKAAASNLIPNEAEAAKALLSYQGTGDDEEVSVVVGTPGYQEWFVEEEPEEVVQNVFDDPRAPLNFPDFEVEVKKRTEEAPYVITSEEFLDEQKYAQATLTYFAGDHVLVDERDAPIENPDRTVGEDNLLKFGQWSNDPKIVYVRNDALDMDYEIVKSEGKYSVDVLGLVEEEKSAKPTRRRSSKARTGGGDDG